MVLIRKTAKSGAAKSACEPKIEKWTRPCADAGYPSHYVGEIVGETRTDCVSPEPKDVWLSNTCAAPIGSSPMAVQNKSGLSVDQSAIDTSSAKAAALSELSSCRMWARAPSMVHAVWPTVWPLTASPQVICVARGRQRRLLGDGPWRWSCSGLRVV